MTALDWYGIVGSALVFSAFCFIRSVATYCKACVAIVVGIGVAISLSVDAGRLSERVITVVGIGLCAFGLLFVRVMFLRSVSLNLLRSIESGDSGNFGADIGGRLRDMRAFRLVQTTTATGLNALSAFGRFVSAFVAAFYALLRVKS